MDIVSTKILVAVLFGLIRFLFGIFPIKVYAWLKLGIEDEEKTAVIQKRRHVLEFAIALVQSFGGGVLFATSFLHMMPEVFFEVEELKSYGVLGADYPFSQLIVSLGFFTVYFAEEISQWLITRTPREPYIKRLKQRGSSATTIYSIDNKIAPEITKIPKGMAFEVQSNKLNNLNNQINLNNQMNWNKQLILKNQIHPNNQFYLNTQFDLEKNEKYFEDNQDAEVVVDNVDQAVQTENIKNLECLQNLETDLDIDEDLNVEIEDFIEEEVKTQQQMLRCFLMVMALSLHAIFEGLAIGLQRSVTNIWYLFTAVSVHSATILFCMGLEVVLAGASNRTTMIHMSMLSGTSPFGVLLGLVITLTTDLHTSAKSFAIVLLEGLSAGTILYITFFETLSREKERRTCRFARSISIGAGFTLMAVLQCFKIGG